MKKLRESAGVVEKLTSDGELTLSDLEIVVVVMGLDNSRFIQHIIQPLLQQALMTLECPAMWR